MKTSLAILTFLLSFALTINGKEIEKNNSPFVANNLSAKVDTTHEDTIKFNVYKKIVWIFPDSTKKSLDTKKDYDAPKQWAGIELGSNGYLTPSNSLSLLSKDSYMDINYRRSFNFNLNFWEQDINIYKGHVRLITGVGLEYNSYELRSNITLVSDSSYIRAVSDSIDYSKNRLKTTSITIPLMLQWNPGKNPDQSIHIAAGIVGAYVFNSKLKQKYELNGKSNKNKIEDDFFISPFRCNATVRVEYDDFNLFATYSLTTLFEKNKGPELYPFTVGITVLGF